MLPSCSAHLISIIQTAGLITCTLYFCCLTFFSHNFSVIIYNLSLLYEQHLRTVSNDHHSTIFRLKPTFLLYPLGHVFLPLSISEVLFVCLRHLVSVITPEQFELHSPYPHQICIMVVVTTLFIMGDLHLHLGHDLEFQGHYTL